MRGFKVSVATLTITLLAACTSTSGAANNLSPQVNPPITTPTVSPSRSVAPETGPVSQVPMSQATDTLGDRAATARTRVLSVRPVNASRKLAAGYHVRHTFVTIRGGSPGGCWAGSTVALAAYRCFTTNNLIIDPCWAEGSPTRTVLCLESPWSTTVTRLKLSGRLDPLPRPRGTVEPWGLHLSNGWKCLAGQGTRDQVNGRPVFYNCDGWRSGRVVLLPINRSRVAWNVQTAVRSTKGAYRMGPKAAVVTAWYAKP